LCCVVFVSLSPPRSLGDDLRSFSLEIREGKGSRYERREGVEGKSLEREKRAKSGGKHREGGFDGTRKPVMSAQGLVAQLLSRFRSAGLCDAVISSRQE
jgi:hypothetical protein